MSNSAPQPSAASDELSGKTRNAAFRRPTAIVLFLAAAAAGLAGDLLSKHYVFECMLSDPAIPCRIESVRRQALVQAGHPEPAPSEVLHLLNLRRRLCPGVSLTLSTNPGIVFGLAMPRWAVGIVTVATIVLVFVFFAVSGAKARLLHLGLACVLAGAMGNLYDRLCARVALPGDGVIRHRVRDFIDCSELYYPWVFNVADALLVVGAAMLVLYSFLADRRARRKAH